MRQTDADFPVRPYRPCWNPRCCEDLDPRVLVPLCPSCRYIGGRLFAIGALLAGLLVGWLR